MLPLRLLRRTLGSNGLSKKFFSNGNGLQRLKPTSVLHQSYNYSTQYYMDSPYAPVDIPDVTIQDYVYKNLEKWPEKIAMECGITGRKYTYSQVRTLSKNVALGLLKSGLKPGQVITLILPNIPEFLISVLGALEAGLVVSTVNPLYNADEIHHQLVNSESVCVITYPQKITDVNNATAKILKKNLQPTIVVNNPSDSLPIGTRSFLELLQMKHGDETQLHSVQKRPDDVALLLYSSGTTGLPKGVILTHRNIVSNCRQIADPIVKISHETTDTHQDTIICVLPFFHIYGITCTAFTNLNYGCKLLTLPKFEPESFLKAFKETHAAYLVPPLIQFLANNPSVTAKDMDKLRIICNGAAAISVSDAQKLLIKKEIKIISGYGMTETSPVITASKNNSSDLGSVGSPVGSSQIKIVDVETGVTIDPSKPGEICVRGPQVMSGYYKNEEATRAMIKDGWLHTGDVGYFGKERLLYIVDRMKELIKVKGFQVAPLELEETLKQHPDVSDSAVVGKPDSRFGEVPVAFVVPKTGKQPTERDLQKFVASKVAEYKQINSVIFMSSIPKNTTGKILRKKLKDSLLE